MIIKVWSTYVEGNVGALSKADSRRETFPEILPTKEDVECGASE